MHIKIKLLELGKRQIDLMPELRKRHFKIQPSELSLILSGQLDTDKARAVTEACMEIIEEWEEAK